jgi:hypothetical protein
VLITEHIRTDPAYRARLRAVGLDRVDRILTRVDGQVVAWSRTTDTVFVPGPDGTPGFYVKRHFFPRWSNRLRGALRGTFFGRHRGQAEYADLNAMRACGIPAVRAVACGGQRVAHFLTACFLITEEVPGAENLTTYAQNLEAGHTDRPARGHRQMAPTLAKQLAHMHAAAVWHGNLFWRNILVRDRPDGVPEFFFLDPQPPRWRRFGTTDGWRRDLAQLAVSAMPFTGRTDRLRFLRSYAGNRRMTAAGKAQARQIAELAKTWLRHETRRIRMNSLFMRWRAKLDEESNIAGGTGLASELPT